MALTRSHAAAKRGRKPDSDSKASVKRGRANIHATWTGPCRGATSVNFRVRACNPSTKRSATGTKRSLAAKACKAGKLPRGSPATNAASWSPSGVIGEQARR
eukprot:8282327-Alexandrium_andersonii.AAC.1